MARGSLGKRITESGQITTAGTAGLLWGYSIKVGTTASAVIQFTNGSGGTVLWEDGWDAMTAAGDVYVRHAFSQPIEFTADIYCIVSGTGTVVCVNYETMGY